MNGDPETIPGAAPAVTGFRKILRNSATLIAARLISKLAMTTFMVVLARRLETHEFGVYSSILAFTAFFSLVEEFGLTPPMIRKIAKSKAEGGEILGRVVGLKLALGVVAYGTLMATAILLDVSPAITAVLGLSMIFEVLSLTVTRAFEAYEMMRQIAIITIVERTLLCAAGLGAIFLGWSLPGLSYAYLFTFICSLALATWMFRRDVASFRPRFPGVEWRLLLREALPFMMASLLSIVWTRADIYFLTTFRTSTEVAWYNAALRIVEAQIFIPVAILSSVFPVLSRLHGRSHREFNHILWKNLVFLFGVGSAVAAVSYLFSTEIVTILFGQKYVESAVILRIFSPVIAVSFVNYLLGGALVAMGKEVYVTATLGLGAVICVAGGLAFIPGNGPPAAGYVKLAAEVCSFGFQGFLLLVTIRRTRLTVETAGSAPEGRGEDIAYERVTSRASDG